MNSEIRLKVGIFQENTKPSNKLCSIQNFETLTDGNNSKSLNVLEEDAETKMSNEFIGKKFDHLTKNNRLDDLKGDSCSSYLNLDHLGNIKN